MRSCSPTWRSLCGSCLVRWQRERAAGLAALHIVSVVYGIVAELGPWPCPLTLAENFFEARAGLLPYQGPFVLHYLDAIVYPNLPPALVLTSGRSEERRVGKEWRPRGAPDHSKRKDN